MAPLIGIPTRTRATGSGALADEMRRAYAQAVAAAGGIPVLLPLVGDPQSPCARLDGLLLAGGCDVDPACYGEPPHPRLGEVDGARDLWELAQIRACLAGSIPVLGICRGHQVMTIASGGALWQDLPSQLPTAIGHDQDQAAAHRVSIEPGSQLGSILGRGPLTVNSRHHQATKTLGAGWRAVAWAEDGLVEGIELPGHPFALGVQWHPEDLQDQAGQRRLLGALVEAAARRASQRG